jgi:hypothetical protein
LPAGGEVKQEHSTGSAVATKYISIGRAAFLVVRVAQAVACRRRGESSTAGSKPIGRTIEQQDKRRASL